MIEKCTYVPILNMARVQYAQVECGRSLLGIAEDGAQQVRLRFEFSEHMIVEDSD